MLSGAITIAIAVIAFIIRIGPDTFFKVLQDSSSGLQEEITALANASTPVLGRVLVKTILIIGLVEEGIKMITMRIIAKKRGTLTCWLDVILLSALVGIGFQFFEDIGYSATGGVVQAIVRSLMPFHFTFGAVMGYFYGKYLRSKKAGDLFLSIVLPTLIHGFFDFSIMNIDTFEFLLPVGIAMIVALLVLTVMMIIKINKWSRDEMMKAPL